MSAATFTGWAVEALIASSLLMGFVLLVRRHAQRALGPQMAYWLWALPVLRMITPPLPAAWRESTAAPISAASEIVLVYFTDPAASAGGATVDSSVPWFLTVGLLWIGGGIAFFAWHGLAHLDYVRRILSPPARREPLNHDTTLVQSDAAIGPVAFGVFRKFVAVPRDFADRYDADERRLALTHELGHHARGDLIANWIGLAMLAVHWFNPLAWVAYRKFRADQEMANDARVLAALPPIERHAYACAIVKAAHGRAVTAACHLHTIEDLKGRLRMLKANRKSRRVLMAGATGIAALTVAGLGLTASGAAAERIRTTAATQVTTLAAQVVSVPVPPSDAAPPPAPTPPAAVVDEAKRKHVIVISKDGTTKRYEGAEADAYIAANPRLKDYADGAAAKAPGEKRIERRVMVFDGKDGKMLTELPPEVRVKLKEIEGVRMAMPPLPPGVAVPPEMRVFPTPGGQGVVVRSMVRRDKDGKVVAWPNTPTVVRMKCSGDGKGPLTMRDHDKDGKPRIMICENRIELHALNQGRLGQMRALEGLKTGRAAVEANRNLTTEQRAQALAGIDQARASIEAQMSAGSDAK